jgi:putative ABC transport system substrate-binding protein
VLQSELTAKALEILKEVVPTAKRFGVLSSPTAPSHLPTMRAAEAAAEKLGVALHTVLVRAIEEFEEAFGQMARADIQAVFVGAYALTVRGRPELLAQLSLKYRLPSMFGARENVAAGGLMCYAPDLADLHRRAATYIDKILKGSKPADLPVEQASQYQLVINLKTAKALGLEVPPLLIAQADELLE